MNDHNRTVEQKQSAAALARTDAMQRRLEQMDRRLAALETQVGEYVGRLERHAITAALEELQRIDAAAARGLALDDQDLLLASIKAHAQMGIAALEVLGLAK